MADTPPDTDKPAPTSAGGAAPKPSPLDTPRDLEIAALEATLETAVPKQKEAPPESSTP